MRPAFYFFILLLLFSESAFSQWQIVNPGTNKNFVDGCFVNDSVGVIISDDGFVFKTSDHGTTWIQCAALPGIYTSVCTAGIDTIYAGGDRIYRSNDRGNTWLPVSFMGYTLTDLAFFGSRKGFAIKPGFTYCTWMDGVHTFDEFQVYQTNDYGVSWQTVFGSAEHTSRFQVIDENTAYVPGGIVNILAHCAGPWVSASRMTTDRGATWNITGQPYGGHSFFSFINPLTGYFIQPENQYSLFKTTDGGGTITESYTELNDRTIKQCAFFNEIDGYLLGDRNIYVTSAGGFNWDPDYTAADTLNRLFKNPANLLFCVGKNGLVLKKTLIPSPYPDTVYRIRPSLTSINFGYVNVNSSSTIPVTIRNTGSLGTSLSINGSNDFKISFSAAPFTTSLNVSLSQFQDTIVYVQFSPHQTGNYKDTLIITAAGMVPYKIPLHGSGFLGLTGEISHDTLICADTTWIGGNLTVKNSSTVTICPGTKVLFLDDYSINVEGRLLALGDSLARIKFVVPDTSQYWSGITVDTQGYNDSTILRNCDFRAKSLNPLVTIRHGYVYAYGCNFTNETGDGIHLYSTGGNTCRLWIENSIFSNNLFNGIEDEDADTTIIRNCDFYNNRRGITFSTNKGLIIDCSKIHDNRDVGIYGFGNLTVRKSRICNNFGGIFFEGSAFRLEDNEIYNNKGLNGGVYCAVEGGNAFILQNVIFNNTSLDDNGGGLSIAPNNPASQPVLVIGNTICNNRTGMNKRGNNFYATSNSSNGLSVKLVDNIFYNTGEHSNSIAWFRDVSHDISFNCITQDSVNIWGQNNIDSDPQFENPTGVAGFLSNIGYYNWSLKVTSPCINAGDTSDISFLLPLDFSGRPRIISGRVDMGAFEYPWMQGTNDLTGRNDYKVYPNPFSGSLTVSVNNYGTFEFRLYDITSRLVLSKAFTTSVTIETNSLSGGIYLYELKGKNGFSVYGKVLK